MQAKMVTEASRIKAAFILQPLYTLYRSAILANKISIGCCFCILRPIIAAFERAPCLEMNFIFAAPPRPFIHHVASLLSAINVVLFERCSRR